MTTPSKTFPIAFSGNIIPPLVVVTFSAFCIKTRSNNGLNLDTIPEAYKKKKKNISQ